MNNEFPEITFINDDGKVRVMCSHLFLVRPNSVSCTHYLNRYKREKYHCHNCPIVMLFHKDSRL